eukprot:Nitzschia sp. Nitz4//scaffold14_size191712//77963//83546//NITZ4_001716-RA/size191712-processed-gene-0.12-mRNA-1//1//CDS//3329536906//8934//frame0
MFPHARYSHSSPRGARKVPVPVGVSLRNVIADNKSKKGQQQQQHDNKWYRHQLEQSIVPILQLQVILMEDPEESSSNSTSSSGQGNGRVVYSSPELLQSIQPRWDLLDERISWNNNNGPSTREDDSQWWLNETIYPFMRLRFLHIHGPSESERKEGESPAPASSSQSILLEVPLHPAKLERLSLEYGDIPELLPPNACLVFFSDGSVRMAPHQFALLLESQLAEPPPVEDFSRFEDDVFRTLDNAPSTPDRPRSESVSALLEDPALARSNSVEEESKGADVSMINALIDAFDSVATAIDSDAVETGHDDKGSTTPSTPTGEKVLDAEASFHFTEPDVVQADLVKEGARLRALIAQEEELLAMEQTGLEEDRVALETTLRAAQEMEHHITLIRAESKNLQLELQKDEFSRDAQQMKLLRELQTVYPITSDSQGLFLIRNLRVPADIYTTSVPDDEVSASLGYCCHLVFMIAKYLGIALRYRLFCNSSRSAIQFDNNVFLPLFFARSIDREQTERGVALLGANVNCILMSHGIEFTAKSHILARKARLDLGARRNSNVRIPHKTILVVARVQEGAAFLPIVSTVGRQALQAATQTPDFNAVEVSKTGGQGAVSAAQKAVDQNLSLGAPRGRPVGGHFLTKGGVQVTANVKTLEFSKSLSPGTSESAIEHLIDQLDSHRGALLTSSYEFPGRYARWSLGFVDPPLEVSGKADKCTIRALNSRGTVLLPAIEKAMQGLKNDGVLASVDVFQGTVGTSTTQAPVKIELTVVPPPEAGSFNEEDRSRQPSLFSVVRSLVDLFGYQDGDGQLGLYGAFGYDLTFSFEPIKLSQDRDPEQRDLLLYLPDAITVIDADKRDAWQVSYDFCVDQKSTQGMPRAGEPEKFEEYKEGQPFEERDTPKGEFALSVEKAKREFAVGNLFEAVLSQTFRKKLDKETPPSRIFRRLRKRNPAPYGFFINLGEQEYLIGASPEMFVRCESIPENDFRPNALRVETCPISGTVSRGEDALEDALRIKSLMMNQKEESELTMCTDVDRNDKSRICEPGSVQVIGRRQIEMYSRLIHTVDHVEGYLRKEFDALDAFLCHTWAVTVTGAPKAWAIQFVEDSERSQRCWYGGAVGMVGFDGSLNTGLTLRTVRVKKGIAEIRAGATLLYDSNPPAEELETELKASAMVDAVMRKGQEDVVDTEAVAVKLPEKVGNGKNIILIDHEDSFVHTLGNYLRQTGASVKTLRHGPSTRAAIEKMSLEGNKPDMIVLSPGPGNPSDFELSKTIEMLTKYKIPAFGVCLGLQGMVEHFGGKLGVLGYPMHGKPSEVVLTRDGLSEKRYHSLHGIKEFLPDCLKVTALSEDGVVMGIQHESLPFAAVQFHPESILTSPMHGMGILQNALKYLKYDDDAQIPKTGAEIVGKLEQLSSSELKEQLSRVGLVTSGSKSEQVVRLALWSHKSAEVRSGRLQLDQLSQDDLRELKSSMGLQVPADTTEELIKVLSASFAAEAI